MISFLKRGLFWVMFVPVFIVMLTTFELLTTVVKCVMMLAEVLLDALDWLSDRIYDKCCAFENWCFGP